MHLVLGKGMTSCIGAIFLLGVILYHTYFIILQGFLRTLLAYLDDDWICINTYCCSFLGPLLLHHSYYKCCLDVYLFWIHRPRYFLKSELNGQIRINFCIKGKKKTCWIHTLKRNKPQHSTASWTRHIQLLFEILRPLIWMDNSLAWQLDVITIMNNIYSYTHKRMVIFLVH